MYHAVGRVDHLTVASDADCGQHVIALTTDRQNKGSCNSRSTVGRLANVIGFEAEDVSQTDRNTRLMQRPTLPRTGLLDIRVPALHDVAYLAYFQDTGLRHWTPV